MLKFIIRYCHYNEVSVQFVDRSFVCKMTRIYQKQLIRIRQNVIYVHSKNPHLDVFSEITLRSNEDHRRERGMLPNLWHPLLGNVLKWGRTDDTEAQQEHICTGVTQRAQLVELILERSGEIERYCDSTLISSALRHWFLQLMGGPHRWDIYPCRWSVEGLEWH